MGSIQPFMEKFGGTFLVAGLIPALAFVTAGMYVFEPIMPKSFIQWVGGEANPLGESWLFMLIVTIIIGFFLTSLNTFILKVFEGYILIWRIPFIRRAELRRFGTYRRKMAALKNLIIRLEKKKGKKYDRILRKLRDREKFLETEFQLNFPSKKSEVLPTRFGNTLKAAESYPMTHYKIDAVPLWTRLIYAIDPSYDNKIELTHNQLSFLINSAVLSALFAIFSFGVAVFQWNVDQVLLNRFLVVGAMASGTTIILNRASILSVAEFGDMIRSAYDLFRFDLLKKLHIPLPENSELELDLWSRISRMINYGYAFEDRYELMPIIYQHDELNRKDGPVEAEKYFDKRQK